MRCYKCGQEVSGRYCNYCGAALETGGFSAGNRKPGNNKEYTDDIEYLDDDLYTEDGESPDNMELLDESVSGDQRRYIKNGGFEEDFLTEYPDQRRSGAGMSGIRNTDSEKTPVRAPKSRKSDGQGKSRKKEKVKKVVVEKEAKSQGKERSYNDRPYDGRSGRRQEGRRMQESADTEEKATWNAGDAVAKGAVGAVILASRIMQLISCFMMASMVFNMAFTFLRYGDGLGILDTMITDENYGLGLYVGAAGFSLFMGVIWCLWILSKKSGGGEIRLRKYDIGRGFYPFLICLAAVVGAGLLPAFLPAEPEALRGLAGGANAFLNAVNSRHSFLMTCCIIGAVLSLIRKVLRV